MSQRKLLGFVLLLAFLVACNSDSSTLGGTGGTGGASSGRGLLVETESGPVEGVEDDGVYSYRGIPYAAPPVGELRWKPPVLPTPWAETLEATEKGNICPQVAFLGLPSPGFIPDEDCLNLNIDTPSQGSELPVMVWIHGGGFTVGEGIQADGGTMGDLIARQTGSVVVSMNYRLGQLGFLAHSALTAESTDEASGNYGLMDQTAALRWVQANIAAFGGDPDNVTILGESAGAFSVCSHLASARSTGLFHKAIVQSGSCERPWPTLAAAEAQGDEFAALLGCDLEEDVLACMRAKPWAELLDTLPQPPNFGFTPSDEPGGAWGPILDGAFFLEQPSESFSNGNFNQVPAIAGFTREEARLFVWIGGIADPTFEVTEDNYVELITHLLAGNVELAERAALEYPLDEYSEPEVALAAVATDTIFRCPGKSEVKKLSESTPTYLYQFEYPDGRSQLEIALPFIPGASLPSYDLAAFHGADIPYVFGYDPVLEIDFENFKTILNPFEPGTVDHDLWLEMLGYFARFAATGDPNPADGVQWPLYAAEADQHLAFDKTLAVGSNSAEKCDFWEGEDYLRPELGQ